MSSYEDRCVKIGVGFHALYFENEVGDPPFFCISDIGNSLSDCSQTMTKICVVDLFRANGLKRSLKKIGLTFSQVVPKKYVENSEENMHVDIGA